MRPAEGPQRREVRVSNRSWEYHQHERDRAVTLGLFGIIAIIVVVALFVAAAVAWSLVP